MKYRVHVLSICFFLAFTAGCSTPKSRETAFYVSHAGDDAWSGKLSEPGRNGKDGPFKTLARARDAVREMKKSGALPQNGITVYIKGGVYPITETFTLTSEDSGTSGAPIIWRAAPGEEVRFMGGSVIEGFEPVKDTDMMKRIDPSYHDSILVCDLKALGITQFGEIKPERGPKTELFYKGQYMPLARYPNEGLLKIAEVPQTGEKLINEGRNEWIMFGVPRGRHYGKFKYDGDRPGRWSPENEIYAHGYWVYDWKDEILKIRAIDTKTREVFPEEPHHGYGYQQEQRYYFLNILEELDSPGEWYLDRANGRIYFWPPSPLNPGDVAFPTLDKVMVSLEEASYVTIRGIIFEVSRAGAVQVKGGSNTLIAGCTSRNLGDFAVTVEGGTLHGVVGCDIYEVSRGGIRLNGGDRKTLTPAGHYANNNHIHHFARVVKTYQPAVSVQGVGNRVSHNLIHDAPHEGMDYGGNEHVFEFNELHHVALETGDVGGIYTAADWTFCGNIFKHNYFHHIHGPVYLGATTIYLDLPVGGAHIYGNVFYDLDRGFGTSSGRNVIIENNIFIKCSPSISFNVWRIYPGATKEFAPGGAWRLVEKLNEMNVKEPPYSTKYPWLQDIFKEGGDPAMPTGNVIIRNISYSGRFLNLHNELDFSIVTVKENLIADPVILHWMKKSERKGERTFNEYAYGDSSIMKELEKYGNMFMNTDPGFVDCANGNFQLKDDSPVYKLGFKRIPIEQIGLYCNEYRPSLPSKANE